VTDLLLVVKGRAQANHKKPTWRILEKSDSIIKWMFTCRMSKNTANLHETSKSEDANKAENAEYIFCRNLFEFCQW
jgi:hypothetical protein